MTALSKPRTETCGVLIKRHDGYDCFVSSNFLFLIAMEGAWTPGSGVGG